MSCLRYSGQVITVLQGHTDQVLSAAFSLDGTRVVTASADKTARVWNVDSGQVFTVLQGHESWVTSVAFSPDGTRVVTASWDQTAQIWDVPTSWQSLVGSAWPILPGRTSLQLNAPNYFFIYWIWIPHWEKLFPQLNDFTIYGIG